MILLICSLHQIDFTEEFKKNRNCFKYRRLHPEIKNTEAEVKKFNKELKKEGRKKFEQQLDDQLKKQNLDPNRIEDIIPGQVIILKPKSMEKMYGPTISSFLEYFQWEFTPEGQKRQQEEEEEQE